MNDQNTLVIINDSYPFDKGETFMENEIPQIHQFDRIFICPCSAENFMEQRNINNDCATVARFQKCNKLIKLFQCMKALCCKETIADILFLQKTKNLNIGTLKQLLSFVAAGQSSYRKIDAFLKDNAIGQNDHIIFYSYWMHFHAYAALRLKSSHPNSVAISRCHGFDLYEYRNESKYIPLRKYILEKLDMIFCICSDGKSYIETQYPSFHCNIGISRLGTLDKGIRSVDIMQRPFKIVSCSSVSQVKRVRKIVDALSKITDCEIAWTHFGDGPLFLELKEYAKSSLPVNIKFDLVGSVSNQEILARYSGEDFHLFLNVSESEGVPVSIMEAISFGIPVVATDVGGTSEIVYDGKNGMLLSENFTSSALASAIHAFATMSKPDYLEYRANARSTWEHTYNAQTNYATFLNELSLM